MFWGKTMSQLEETRIEQKVMSKALDLAIESELIAIGALDVYKNHLEKSHIKKLHDIGINYGNRRFIFRTTAGRIEYEYKRVVVRYCTGVLDTESMMIANRILKNGKEAKTSSCFPIEDIKYLEKNDRSAKYQRNPLGF